MTLDILAAGDDEGRVVSFRVQLISDNRWVDTQQQGRAIVNILGRNGMFSNFIIV